MLTSCLKDQDDVFELSSSDRLQQTNSQLLSLLRSSEYGWEFEYYPGSNLEHGGIVYVMKFDSLTVDVSCSLIPDSTETSYYRVTTDSGPVLTFDTYNALFHYFSTPSSGEYQAKGGEFEFLIQQLSDTLITLSGKKTGNRMYLRRLTSSSDDYAAKTVSMYDNMAAGFKGTIGDTEVEGIISQGSRRLALVVGSDTVSVPFAYNDRGIRLYRPVRLGGSSVQAFTYDVENNLFSCPDATGEVALETVPYSSDVVRMKDYAGRYTLRYNERSAIAVTLEPNRLDGSYQLTGLSKNLRLKLDYDYATGKMTLAPQVVGEVNGATVYFVTFNASEGHPWLSEAASFTLNWNGNKTRVAYNFTATNPSVYNCDSGLLIKVLYNDEGALTAEIMTESDWLVNGSAMMYYMSALQKQR